MTNDLSRRSVIGAGLSMATASWLGSGAAMAADPWPSKQIRMVVPYTPGTGMDILARTLAPKLAEAWGGVALVVDNRPGASGNLGAGMVAKAAPDGYTLLTAPNTLVINRALYTNMTYDPLKDLSPIGLCTTGSFLLVANSASGITSVADLVTKARARPGFLTYASPGIATPHHMAMELFKSKARVFITHIPFSGTAPALNTVLSGEIPVMFLPVHVAMAQVKGGRLVALAAGGAHRSALAPNVQTLSELGYSGAEADLWYGLAGPAGLPADIVAKVNADMIKALALPDVKTALVVQGMEIATSSPQEMADVMRKDAARWAAVVKDAGIKAE